MTFYIRAEQETEFALHLYVDEQIFPYIFAAKQWNYARDDGIAYMRIMERLPNYLGAIHERTACRAPE